MKNYLLPLTIVLLTLTLFHCTSETDNKKEAPSPEISEFDSTDLPTTKINETIKYNFDFVYNFKENESFTYRLTSLVHNQREIKSDTTARSNFEQKIIRVMNFQTIALENDTIADIECVISGISVEADNGIDTLIYKSGSKMDSLTVSRFIEHEGIINNPFSIRITKYGKLVEVYNLEGVINKFLELSGMTDSINVEEKEVLKNELKTSLITPLMKLVFTELPTEKMGLTSSWQDVMDPLQLMAFNIISTNNYNISAIELLNDERIAIISGSTTSSVEGKLKHGNNEVTYLFEEPKLDADTKLYYNIAKGLIHKSKTKTRIEISYSMEMNTPEGPSKGSALEIIINDNILELL